MKCRAVPYEGTQPYIFISYCPGDRENLYPLFEQMAQDGCRLWYDDGSAIGRDWQNNIERHLEACRVVIAFVSENYGLDPNSRDQIISGMMKGKKVLPVVIENRQLPKGLRMQLRQLRALVSSDYDSFQALLAKLYETEDCKACRTAGKIKLNTERGWGFFTIYENKKNFWHNLHQAIPEDQKEKQEPGSRQTTAEEEPKGTGGNSGLRKEPEREPEKVPEKEPEKEPERGPEKESEKEPEGEAAPGDSKEEKTVYKDRRPQTEPDEGKTVCVRNRNLAFLLYPAEKRAYRIRKPQTKIGRSSYRCDVVLSGNGSVSNLHAEVLQYRDAYSLCDAGSTNGTFLEGVELQSGVPVPLGNPAVFLLNDEPMILLSGQLARKCSRKGAVSLLMNGDCSAVCILEEDDLPLNRNHIWKDKKTMYDLGIHRASHARLQRRADGVYLVDETPEESNGTYWNDRRMNRGESGKLSSGDRIQLGDTMLEFVTIALKE